MLMSNSPLQCSTRLSECGYTKAKLKAEKKLWTAVSSADKAQEAAKGEAKKATKKRDDLPR